MMKATFLYSFLLGLLLVGCNPSESEFLEVQRVYESDLETTVSSGDKEVIPTAVEGVFLEHGELRSTDFSRSGSFSVKIDSLNEYALNFRLVNPTKGEFYRLSVWQKKGVPSGCIIARVKGPNYNRNFRSYYSLAVQEEDDWVQHEITFVVEKECEQLDVYVFAGGRVAYFDDFKVERFQKMPESNFAAEPLELFMKDSVSYKMNSMIKLALNKGIIPDASKSYVKAKYILATDTAKVKMKLKGDFTDHIESGKTSYRIKIRGDYSYKGLKQFSIQHPQTRNYLHEWLIHKMANTEDVLATKYDFAPVTMNGVGLGVFAIEEHFAKQLLERQNRREGPILKFDESGAWAYNYAISSYDNQAKLPYFQASVIKPFKVNKTIKSPGLSKQFSEGNVLLGLFKSGHKKVSDIFDLDQLAKFYVLVELSGNNHALAWHNRRFYYNSINQKLEHILFDVLPFYDMQNYVNFVDLNLKSTERTPENIFDRQVFLDIEFQKKYCAYLEKFTEKSYIDSVFSLYEDELLKLEAALQTESPFYKFDKNLYYENAAYQKALLPGLEERWISQIQEDSKNKQVLFHEVFEARDDKLVIPEIAVNVFVTKLGEQYNILAENYHVNDVELVGYKCKDTSIVVMFDKPILLSGYATHCDSVEFQILDQPKELYYIPSNNKNQVCKAVLFPWTKAKKTTTRMRLENQFKFRQNYYTVNGNQVVFSGNVVVDELLLIPAEYDVVVKPGTVLELKNGGGIIATNSFYALGTASQPINIFCKDSTSNGVTVLNGEVALLSYVSLQGLSNLNHENWELTGALCIYETTTSIDRCEITGNHSEDALNIIRSNFNISHLNVSNTFSDGFDADFCTGTIQNSQFTNTGNDCMDFSGSTITVKNCQVYNSGDKGVSGGEASAVLIKGLSVNRAVTGIASKDGSVVRGRDITIDSTEFACAAFRKKPEYNAAQINLDNIQILKTNEALLIDLGSTIVINGEDFKGKEKLDVDALYLRFE